MPDSSFKTELDYELKKFNKEKEVKELNETFENQLTTLSLNPPMAAPDLAISSIPDPALIELQIEHKKQLARIAKQKGYNLVYEYLTKEED